MSGAPVPASLPGVATRVAAARVLDAVLHRHRSLRAELGPALSTLPDPRDRALAEAIVLAVLRAIDDPSGVKRYRVVRTADEKTTPPPAAAEGSPGP